MIHVWLATIWISGVVLGITIQQIIDDVRRNREWWAEHEAWKRDHGVAS